MAKSEVRKRADRSRLFWRGKGGLVALLLVGLVVFAGGTRAGASEEFTNTEPLPFHIVFHTATLLTNGLVLVAGGTTNGSLNYSFAKCELYDPETRTWTPTASMNYGRGGHIATLLPNGKVLVAGGVGLSTNNSDPSVANRTAELYDPVTETWKLTGSIPPPTGPSTNGDPYSAFAGGDGSTANLLENGKVLVAGGEVAGPDRPYAYLYNPANGTWTQTGSLKTPRFSHTATTLTNGFVLVTGGFSNSLHLASAELYNPNLGTWSFTSPMNESRVAHTATLLTNGWVLVTGGRTDDGSAELYDSEAGSWQFTADMAGPRINHTATLLTNGWVLVAGGQYFIDPTIANLADFGEFYDPANETWYEGGPMVTNRFVQTATLMTNGGVLLAGGDAWPGSYFNPIAGAEEMIAGEDLSDTNLDLPPPHGSLKVTLVPAGAVGAGAQWQVDGGILHNSGVVSNLAVGLHTVSYSTNVSGWSAPAPQTVTINAGLTNSITGTYTQLAVPLLAIWLTNGSQVVVTWPYPSTGSNLQQNASLATVNWSTVTNVPVQVGSRWQVTIHTLAQAMFYRLH